MRWGAVWGAVGCGGARGGLRLAVAKRPKTLLRGRGPKLLKWGLLGV